MKIVNDNRVDFGWRYRVHKDITKNTIDTTLKTISKNDSNKIIRASASPDFDEKAILCQTHFFFPNTKRSYLDITGTLNAKSKYYEHVKAMIKNRTNKEIALEHAGRAVHFLQDICQPQHISEGTIIKKAIERPLHKEFEEYAYQNKDRLINERFAKTEIKAKSFSDLFKQTLSEAVKIDKPSKNNKTDWNNIAQNGINTAINATQTFLKMVNHILN